MKIILLVSCSGLLIAGSARAQQLPSTQGDTVRTVELVRTPPPKRLLLTAADSARERARQANARQLRQQAAARPAAAPAPAAAGFGPLGLSAPKRQPVSAPEAPTPAEINELNRNRQPKARRTY